MQARGEPDVDLPEIPPGQKQKMAKPVENYFDQAEARYISWPVDVDVDVIELKR